MNIWAGPNRPAAPDKMARLIRYELLAHDPSVMEDAKALPAKDPSGVEVKLTPAFAL